MKQVLQVHSELFFNTVAYIYICRGRVLCSWCAGLLLSSRFLRLNETLVVNTHDCPRIGQNLLIVNRKHASSKSNNSCFLRLSFYTATNCILKLRATLIQHGPAWSVLWKWCHFIILLLFQAPKQTHQEKSFLHTSLEWLRRTKTVWTENTWEQDHLLRQSLIEIFDW